MASTLFPAQHHLPPAVTQRILHGVATGAISRKALSRVNAAVTSAAQTFSSRNAHQAWQTVTHSIGTHALSHPSPGAALAHVHNAIHAFNSASHIRRPPRERGDVPYPGVPLPPTSAEFSRLGFQYHNYLSKSFQERILSGYRSGHVSFQDIHRIDSYLGAIAYYFQKAGNH